MQVQSFAANAGTVTTLKISAGSWLQMVTTRELKKYCLASIL